VSNDKHPDHHFDDELIAQLYESSKEEIQPSTDLDDLILSTLNETAGDKVVDADDSIDANVVSLLLSKDEENRAPQNTSKRKKWFVPNSLVACLVVSVMVGLIYRENADNLLISDPMELDYTIPMPSVERRISTKAKAVAFDEDKSSESDATLAGTEVFGSAEKEIQESSSLMSEDQTAFDRNDVGGSFIMKQEVAEKKPSRLQVDAVTISTAVSGSRDVSESKATVSKKLKKSKPKPLMRQSAPARMLMTAPLMHLQEEVPSKIDFDVRFNQIRKLRDAGDEEGAMKLLDVLLIEYPSIDLPDDIIILKQSF